MADAGLRVTHVVFDLNGGGLESLVAAMVRRQAGTRISVSVISLSGREGRVGAAIAPLLDQYHVLRPWPGVSMLLPLGLTRAIHQTRADVVHLHSGSWFKGALAARLARVPGVVYTEHGREHNDPPLAQWIDRRAAALTDAVVPVSDRLAEYLERVVGIEAKRLHVIQNGVDTSVFAPGAPPAELRARLGIPDHALVVGSVGRLESVKAYSRLVEAVAALRAAPTGGRPVVGVIWGEGSERAVLESLIADRGLAGSFFLPGWTEDAVASHRLLDVFVLPSISEGASVSLMESMASGVTPVAMNVGASAEIVGPDLAGQVVPAGDQAALVRILEVTLQDDAHRRRAAELGRRRMVTSYSLDAMLGAYERLYRELAAPRTPPPARPTLR